jgi:hypothetical protein
MKLRRRTSLPWWEVDAATTNSIDRRVEMKEISFIWMAILLTVASTAFAQDVRYNFDIDQEYGDIDEKY